MKGNQTVNIGVRVEKEVLEIIKKKAKEEGMTPSRYAASILEKHIGFVLNIVNINVNKEEIIHSKPETLDFVNINVNKEEDPPGLNTYIPDLPFRMFLLDGKRTNMTTLAREMNISLDEVKEYLLTLEKSRIKKIS